MANVAGRLFLASVLGLSLLTAQPVGKIRVCASPIETMSPVIWVRAKFLTTRILASAGVTLEWGFAGQAICQQTQATRLIILDFQNDAPANQHPDAMAYAEPYGGSHFVVYLNRVVATFEYGQSTKTSSLLAHVMAHEIGHLLEGVARHSDEGIMKAHWTGADYVRIATGSLRFAPEDLDLIRDGMARRAKGEAELH